MKINRRLLAEARQARIKIIVAISLGFLAGVLGIFQAFGLSRIINQVFLYNYTLQSVTGTILIVLIIVIFRVGFLYLGEITASDASGKIKQGLRRRLFSHLYALGPAYLQGTGEDSSTRTGELVNLASEGIDALDAYFSQYIPQIALAVLVPAAILLVVFPTDILSGIILLVTAPLMPIFMYLIGSAADSLTRKQWLGLNRMSAYFLDVLQGLTTLKSFGRSKEQVKIIEKVSDQYRLTTMGVLRVTFLSALVLELVGTLSTAVVAVEIGIRLLYGRMAFEQAFFILLLAPEFYLPLRLLGARFHASMAGAEAGKQIFEVLDRPVRTESAQINNAEAIQSKPSKPPSIVINGLRFAYPGSPPVLDDLTVHIPAGKMTALIGESGAGKTTLSWLLLRFLRPDRGEILIDGKDITDIPIDEWNREIAWVPQNPFLFDETIAANIKLARPEADLSAIQQAVRLAHAEEFISQMPLGYDTRIGEQGSRLSAGQAQRIALARAFLKDAPLLILDEATSHLDPLTDAQLQESLQQLVRNRTVLVIAHRKSTISKADQVIRLDQGRIENITREQLQPGNGAPLVETSDPLRGSAKPIFTARLPGPILNEANQVVRMPSSYQRFIDLLTPFWSRILFSVLLGFATIASGIGLMATSAYIISAAALHPSIADLQVAIVGVRFFGIARGVFRYLERLVSHDVTFRLLARWRVQFYQALEPLAPARLQHYHSGDLLARVIKDIDTLESFYVRTLNPPIVAIMVSAGALLFLRGFGDALAWGLLVFLVLAGILLPMLAFTLSRRIGPASIRERGKYDALMVDSIQGLPELVASGRVEAQIDRISRQGEALERIRFHASGITSLQTALGTLLANLGMLTVLVLAIEKVSTDQLSGVLLGVVALTAFTCFEAMQPLPQVVQNMQANQAAAHRLYELVDSPIPVNDPIEPREVPEDLNFAIRDLSFRYPSWEKGDGHNGQNSSALTDISLSLSLGKHIAILGASGAGKTTLINLLLRFWEYQGGSILLGDQELRAYRQEDIRKQIAYVSQNSYLFCATIKDNLLIARPSATMEEIRQAGVKARLDSLIQVLPDGYDTWIGEHGLRLSAGERQRLAVARAFLKDAPLLVLDEPTANLDPENEHGLIKSIHDLSQGKSLIYITQNMVGLDDMDEIIVLHHGCIVERGKHAQLIAARGLYRQMWDLYHQIV